MIKVEEIAEKYKGYEVDEEKLKEFLTPPKPMHCPGFSWRYSA